MAPNNKCYSDVFELAAALSADPVLSCDAFHRIYSFVQGTAECFGNSTLQQVYGADLHSRQVVVSVTNRVTCCQTWYNKERSKKPQTFFQSVNGLDPTSESKPCDFCRWQTYTAEDPFGRVETTHTVTASNLFKYCQPFHGLVLFKHHDPLQFSLKQFTELLSSADKWFTLAAHHASLERLHPFFIWNCLPRAGASQFHGHAQVMLSQVAFPTVDQLHCASVQYQAAHPAANYYHDMIAAHHSVGLARSIQLHGKKCWCYAVLAPIKDMEVQVQGDSLTCAAFQTMLYVVLRALIDELGVLTFNVGIYNIAVTGQPADGDGMMEPSPVLARVVSRGRMSSKASDYGGLEVFGGASIGNTDPFRVIAAVDCALSQCNAVHSD